MKSGSVLVITLFIAGLLVAGGAVAYVATDGFGSQNNSQETSSKQKLSTEEEVGEMNDSAALIKSALEGKGAITCTFTQNDYSGTAYITSDKNFRVDAQSDEGMAHMIKRGASAYIWVDGQSEGFEFSGESYDENFDERFDSFNPEEFETEADASTVTDIDCKRAKINQAKYVLPDDINFQSWEDLMRGLQGQQ